MSKSFLMLLFCVFVLSSCAGAKNKILKKDLARGEEHFSYTDKNGEYLVRIISGFNKKDNALFTKRSLESTNSENEKVLEQSVVFSELGSLKKKKPILRPKLSQYTVWFEGKKFFSELKLNPAKKSIDVKMASPESQWNGVKQIKLPNTKALYCFFSQVIECAKTVGFLHKALEKEAGSMNFYVIWEGYPYLNETFTDFPSELFSKAQLEYDGDTVGKKNENEKRFNLKVAGQSIFYIVDKNEQLSKMFWVSQGISMVNRSASKKPTKNKKTNESFEKSKKSEDSGESIE